MRSVTSVGRRAWTEKAGAVLKYYDLSLAILDATRREFDVFHCILFADSRARVYVIHYSLGGGLRLTSHKLNEIVFMYNRLGCSTPHHGHPNNDLRPYVVVSRAA